MMYMSILTCSILSNVASLSPSVSSSMQYFKRLRTSDGVTGSLECVLNIFVTSFIFSTSAIIFASSKVLKFLA